MTNSALTKVAFAIGLAAAFPFPALAQDIDTTGGAPLTDFWNPFGSPDTATYGQTFTAGPGQSNLQAFSLFLGSRRGGAGPLSLKGYFGTWNGDRLGTVLFSSDVRSTLGQQELSFNTGGLALNAGSQYVAFLSISELGSQDFSVFAMPRANAPLSQGNFVFQNNGTNFGLLTSNSWAVTSPQVAFKASFGGVPGAVPEPGTWAMMLIGFGFVGGAMRFARRRQQLTVTYA